MSPLEAVALFLPTLFLLMGEANMYQKFFSAKDERAARLAVVGWIVGTIVLETLIDSVGIFGSVVQPGLGTSESEAIVVRVALTSLPMVLGVLLLAGAAAIIVSTANSFLLTPATNLMRDVYQRFVNPRVTDRQIIIYTRGLVVLLGSAGFVIGNFFPSILAMALWAYTMYGAGITPALLAALIWTRATPQGGVASIAAGMITTIAWEVAGLTGGYPLGLPTVYPALVLSIATLIAVSLSTTPRAPAKAW
jgi:SSS family solute:Na+ symporter/sodium/proline symporter